MLILKRFAGWLVLSLLTAGLIVGCGLWTSNNSGENQGVDSSTHSPTSECRVIKHDLGETQICGQPQKVVALSAYNLDLLLSLNMQPAGYAAPLNVHRGKVFDNPAQQIPYLGTRMTNQPVNLGKSGEPSLEKLAALKPDLILAAGGSANSYDLLSQIAPTLLWKSRGLKGQWQKNLGTIAAALGRKEKAEEVIQQYEARINDARAEFADVVAAHPLLLLLGAMRLDEGIGIIGADSYLDELLSGVGFQLISQPPANINLNGPISVEALPMLNHADTIIILGYNLDTSDGLENPEQFADKSVSDQVEKHQVQTIQQDWEENAIAQSLTASKEDRVYFATFYKWMGLNGPIGAELVLKQLRQFFTE
ncbi:MAG: iron-siderophore ABC transporter substrate-binding protein [Moorea sp. SIO2I5]|nr:iron-siderophore ABC transporter substrate-binding protein [Moorena sp. SIO2I5]